MNFLRESDRFFDEPFAESELNGGIDNHITQSQPLRSRENIYEYKDSPVKASKSQNDFNSVRSPSSLGMTQMTNITKVSGSQSSLRSAISLKESPTLHKELPIVEKKEKYAEREVDVRSDKSDKASSVISSSTFTNASTSSVKKDLLTSSPVPHPRLVHKPTNHSRTILESGIPQTEV